MCRVIPVLAALLLIPLGASLDGQTTGPVESELVARIDSLSEILGRADSLAKVADAARDEEQRRLLTARADTFEVGPFSVVTVVGRVGLTGRLFEGAWARYAAIVGTEPTSIEGHVFLFAKRSEQLRGLEGRGGTRITTRFMSSDRDGAIGRVIGGVLAHDLPEDLRTWAGDFLIRADPTDELERAYRALVTTASSAVTDCYDGVFDRCWDAMGLDHQDEWASTWYTASERRELVRRLGPSPGPLPEGAVASCVDDERDDACAGSIRLPWRGGLHSSAP